MPKLILPENVEPLKLHPRTTKPHTRACTRCHEEYPLSDLTEFDGELLCLDCIDRLTVVCHRCGRRIWKEDNKGGDTCPLCPTCAHTNRDSHLRS